MWYEKKRTQQEASHDNRVEVVVNKEANKQAVKKAKEVNKQLNDILGQNHFTMKIFLAAGGKTKKGNA